jgi:hypothetical protein
MKLKYRLAEDWQINNGTDISEAYLAYLAGFDKAREMVAKKFDPYSNGHRQTFETDNDGVDLTYRIMAIIEEHILDTGEDEV